MSSSAILLEGVSKKFKIGARREDTLRDRIANLWRRRKLDRTAHEIWALKDIDLEVQPGEVLGIIGRNGAGKSTLLKLLAHITQPTEGRVTIRGRVGSLLEVGTGFHTELTGRENIYLNGAILGMRRAEIQRKFDQIVDFAEVEKFLDTPVKFYSSGMHMRLAFAVAAHLEPEIMLVDEVLAVGDADFQKKCLGKMDEVTKQGRTVLFVSHNMAAVQGLCNHAILLERGKIKAKGKTKEVIDLYLETLEQKTAVNLVNTTERDGDGRLRIKQITIGTEDNPQLGKWVCGENCVIDFHYVCNLVNELSNVEFAYKIMDRRGFPIFFFGTKVVQQKFSRVSGDGVIRCVIQKLPVMPGYYFINFDIVSNGVLVDLVDRAADVQVVEGDFYGSGVIWYSGVALADYHWMLIRE